MFYSEFSYYRPNSKSNINMAVELERAVAAADSEINIESNETLMDVVSEEASTNPQSAFLRSTFGTLVLFLIWFAFNFCRIIQEKRKIQEQEEKEEFERYLMVSKICNILEKNERQKSCSFNGRSKRKRYRRRTLKKSSKRNLTNRSLAKLWNKLNEILLSQRMTSEKVSYQFKEISFSSDETENKRTCKPSCSQLQSSCPEVSAFVPKLQTIGLDNYQPKAKCSTPKNLYSSNSSSHCDPMTSHILVHPDPEIPDIFESHPMLLAPSELPESDNYSSSLAPAAIPAAFHDSCTIDCDYLRKTNCNKSPEMIAKDSGFLEANGSANIASPISNDMEVKDILHHVEEYNLIKNVELCSQIEEAQMQVKSEMGDLKSTFRLPPENVKITQSQIFNSTLLQNQKKMLSQVGKKMNFMRSEIENSKKNSKKLFDSSKNTKKTDAFAQLMRSLFWERKHEERLYKARSKIIESVKSAMKTRFIGMASKERSGVPLADNNFCYDCATGRHKRFFVDGVDGCDIEGEDKILREADGFNKDCRVVRVINSWYKELELKRGDSVQVKADKIETLLNKVLKEMFLKRYHERGQLISQKYLTVSSTLAQFVFISPKSSIPPSDD